MSPTRRTVIGGAAGLAARLTLGAGPAAAAPDAAAPASEPDMFTYMIKTLGEPADASRVSAAEASRYADRVPPALTRFWIEHGRGAYLDGMYWICDPAPFDPLLEDIFNGDPEFNPAEMTVVAYTAFGSLRVWHRQRRKVNVDLLVNQVFNPPASSWHDSKTGQPYAEDFSVANHVAIVRTQYAADETAFLKAAIAAHGRLRRGEVYGFFPALQLGGRYRVEAVQRVKAVEHFVFLAQLSPFSLVGLTPPEPPAHPYGRTEVVRQIGPAQP